MVGKRFNEESHILHFLAAEMHFFLTANLQNGVSGLDDIVEELVAVIATKWHTN